MPAPSKAQIRYEADEVSDPDDPSANTTQVLRFNAVVAEAHEFSSTVTKFPVQTGEIISNHAIRQNRKISISGIVTNTPLDDPEGEFVNYSVNNQKTVFETLRLLIKNSTPVEIITNLGIYYPVILNGFKTTQKEGWTDAIDFTIKGEEIQIGTSVGKGTPVPLVFSALGLEESLARREELTKAGYDVAEDSILSQASIDLATDFSYITTDELGNKKKTTYHYIDTDPVTGRHNHEVSVTNIPTAGVDPSIPDPDGGDPNFLAGVSVAAACLAQQAIQKIKKLTEDYIETSLGKLKKATYGFLYEKLGVNGNSDFGQMLLGIAVDCFVAGAVGTTGALTPEDFDYASDIPTSDDLVKGAKGVGNRVATDNLSVAAPTTLTKISPADGGGTKFFGDSL